MGRFVVKDSGERQQFESGMVRDVSAGKVDYSLVLDGPMFDRWAAHLEKGAVKYERRNWMKAEGAAELERFKQSAFRHFLQWMRGDVDEDHAAAVLFNINGAEYVKARIATQAPAAVDALPKAGRLIDAQGVEVVDDHGHVGYLPAQRMGAQ